MEQVVVQIHQLFHIVMVVEITVQVILDLIHMVVEITVQVIREIIVILKMLVLVVIQEIKVLTIITRLEILV